MREVSKEEKYACAMRELGLRKKHYPRWVVQGRMADKEAKREIEAMEAIMHDYEPRKLL
jgi:hypothetical protein